MCVDLDVGNSLGDMLRCEPKWDEDKQVLHLEVMTEAGPVFDQKFFEHVSKLVGRSRACGIFATLEEQAAVEIVMARLSRV